MRGKLIALSSDCDLPALNTEFIRKKVHSAMDEVQE